MTSIRKIKKWYKSLYKKEVKKKLETIHKYPELHRYIMRHRNYKGVFCVFAIRTKSKRKRGKHEG